MKKKKKKGKKIEEEKAVIEQASNLEEVGYNTFFES